MNVMDYSIMIIDDNEYLRDSVEILFRTEKMKIVTASGGHECLDLLEKGFRGVLLMDVMMPHMDGWETISQIVERGLYEGNIILMLTAKDEPDNKMENTKEYITDYITKPFDPMQLVDVVRYYSSLLTAAEPAHGES